MRRNGLAILLLGAFTAPPTAVWSQPRLIETVRGEVRKQLSDGRLIPGALVTVSLAPAAQVQIQSTITGWDGFYYFEDVQPGSYALTVSEKGKQPQTFRVDLRQIPDTDVPPVILSARLKDHRPAYANALRAILLEDWSGAIHILRQLLTLHPENRDTRRELIETMGNYKELYRPHYYLGFALQKLGDCDEALQQWKIEESLGELKSTHRKGIREGRLACSQS